MVRIPHLLYILCMHVSKHKIWPQKTKTILRVGNFLLITWFCNHKTSSCSQFASFAIFTTSSATKTVKIGARNERYMKTTTDRNRPDTTQHNTRHFSEVHSFLIFVTLVCSINKKCPTLRIFLVCDSHILCFDIRIIYSNDRPVSLTGKIGPSELWEK